MVQAVEDPFQAYGPPKDEARIFSILPPLGLGPSSALARTSMLSSTASLPDLPYNNGHSQSTSPEPPLDPNMPTPRSSPELSRRTLTSPPTTSEMNKTPSDLPSSYFSPDTPKASRSQDLSMIEEVAANKSDSETETDEEGFQSGFDEESLLEIPGGLNSRTHASRETSTSTIASPPAVTAVG